MNGTQTQGSEKVKNEKKTKKGKTPAVENAKNMKKSAESLRYLFIRMIVVVAESTTLDLRYVLRHPITKYPLSLAHVDGGHVTVCFKQARRTSK